MKSATETFEIVCGKCKHNDNGLCDMVGLFINDDDPPICRNRFERKKNNDEDSD